MPILTIFFGEFGFEPNRLDIGTTDVVDYWYHIAEQAVEFFHEKDDFMAWVCTHYFQDEHRFAASGCWTLAMLDREIGIIDDEED